MITESLSSFHAGLLKGHKRWECNNRRLH